MAQPGYAGGSLRAQQRRVWRKFRADPKLWIERCLKVINKQGKEVPAKLNFFQNHYYKLLKKLYWKPYQLPSGKWVHRFQGIREVNLKSRQIGGSALINWLLLHDTLFFPGTRTWLFCQDDPASKTMLEEKVKFSYNSINHSDPLIVMPKAGADNTSVLGFPSISSKYSCRSPGQSPRTSRKKGRSITLRNALLSELAEWPYAEELLQGIDPALNDPTTNIFIESSPKLKGDYFYRFYQLAKAGEGGWQARFWPWFFDEDLREPIYTQAERQTLAASLSEEELALMEMAREQHNIELDLERIKWRRKTKASPTLAAKGPMAYRQEYLESDVDCFEAKGTSIFRDDLLELKVLTTREREAIPGRMHAIGVDVADGAGGDFAYITVVDAVTREQIFKWKSNKVDSTQLHRDAFDIWQRFPGVVAIETNGIGRATIAKARSDTTLVKDENGIERELWSIWDEFLHCGHGTYDGLPTLSEKSTTIYLLRAAIREAVEHYGPQAEPGPPDKPGIGLRIGSQDILDQFDDFQNLGNGKMGAPPGTEDDGIMSLSLAFRLLSEIADYEREFHKRFTKAKAAA
ncbi:MAG: hypothetical protein ACO1RX_20100 [Candidatus Sericytochromatia bacterium]